MPTLKKLVDEYRSLKDPEDPWLSHCKDQRGLGEQAYAAGWARNGQEEKHPHQYRIPNDVLKKVGKRLRKDEGELKQCKDFDSIHRFVEKRRVPKFGQLAIYDAALRIGYATGNMPDKVYLHAGTAKGAKYYGIRHENKHFIMSDELPEELRSLPSHLVEDFLCVYKTGELQDGDCTPRSKSKSGTICLTDEEKPRRSKGC